MLKKSHLSPDRLMSSTSNPNSGDDRDRKPEIELASDEGWKDKVRRENEQLEAEFRAKKSADRSPGESPPPPADSGTKPAREHSGSAEQVPPPTFASLMSMLSTQAMIGLGAFADPEDESSGPHLDLAKHFIDLLGLLETKTAGNLTAEESRLLAGTLHELRMAYIEVSRQQSAPKASNS
jgi:hypothetical protein